MPLRPYRKKAWLVAAGTLVVVSALVSTHLWQNTNVLGATSFCDGRVRSGDAQDVLDSPGRLSDSRVQTIPGKPEFTCVIERRSLFSTDAAPRIALKTASELGPFPYTTHVWKNPGARSYFKGEVTGGVTPTGGYVVLPKSCWAKVGDIQGSRLLPPDDNGVAAVEATVTAGRVAPEALARLLARTAASVAADAGCSVAALKEPPELAAPEGARTTDSGKVCGLPDFALPDSAVLPGAAEPGQERVSRGTQDVWACDLALVGKAGASVSFTATSDPAMVEAALKGNDDFRTLPDGQGVALPNQAIVQCADGDVFFTALWSKEYYGALRDHHPSVTDVYRETFASFVSSAADLHSCPNVTIP